MNKDLLGLRDCDPAQVADVLAAASTMKGVLLSGSKKTPHLQGKSVVLLFYENSTRTRVSFELASKYMSSSSANITASASSVAKGETLIDTGRTLDRMATDVIVIRHPMSGAAHLMAKHVRASVINAGDGTNEHPTQALLDMFTIKQHKGSLHGLKVAIVGDVLHSRVARSNVWGLTAMGADVVVGGAPTLMYAAEHELPVTIAPTVDDAVRGADVVMGLRIQLERQGKGLFPSAREYIQQFGLTPERVALASRDAIVLHPGPMNRGVDISSYVADADNSLIDEQVENGVAVRMALLYIYSRRSA